MKERKEKKEVFAQKGLGIWSCQPQKSKRLFLKMKRCCTHSKKKKKKKKKGWATVQNVEPKAITIFVRKGNPSIQH